MAAPARTVFDYLMLLIPPIVSSAYLAFCWTVLYRTIILPNHGLIDTSVDNIAIVKSGVTTISIMIVALGLWPIKGLLVDIQSEEFFRVLKRPHNRRRAGSYRKLEKPHEMGGINFVAANSMSSVFSLGMIDTVMTILKRQSSPHFSLAFVSSFIVLGASTLAPAALSVHEALLDSDLMAIEVGAIPVSSVIAAGSISIQPTRDPFLVFSTLSYKMERPLTEASSLAWAETALNFNYSFAPPVPSPSDSTPQYIVPFPVNLAPDTSARWLSDAFILRPSCKWYATNLSTEAHNAEDIADESMIPLTIPDLDINLYLSYIDLGYGYPFSMWYYSTIRTIRVGIFNSTTGDIAQGGHSVWAFAIKINNATNDLSQYPGFRDIPMFELRQANTTIVQRWAFLVCSPNLSVETVEVLNDRGSLTITPADTTDGRQPYIRQGNLDRIQGEFLFAGLFSKFADSAGPAMERQGQSLAQASLIFGWDQMRAWNRSNSNWTWSPMPESNITEMYSRYIRAGSKAYLSGALGTSFVPGITSTPILALAASRPHVIASTMLFVVLDILSVVAFFRSGRGVIFNLMRVASVLHESNVTEEMARFVEEKRKAGEDASLEQELAAEAKDRILRLDDKGEVGVLTMPERDAS
ncbi:hypothetical protein AX16_007715 [Volvariella volvacea WC 439]|nr:hypothetical protein AX16_007715 [Volvariella volvacea WC 439]